jgi:tetratricopeptide (TPR) repeat protein
MNNYRRSHHPLHKAFKMTMPVIAVLFLIVFSSSALSASSSIKGIVTEKGTQTPLAGVKITLESLKTSTVRFELTTDKKGYFYKTGLSHGMYRVSLEKDGYVPSQVAFRLRLNDQYELNVELEVTKAKTSNAAFELVSAARKLMAAGKYDEAIAKVSQAIEKDPESFILYYNRAVGYEKKGDRENAALDYRKSLELKPDFLLSLAALGKIHARKAEFEKAVEYYKKAFDLNITDTAALYNYGACLVNLGGSEEAKAVFEKLISLDDNYADAFYQLGIIYLGLNDNARAIEYLKKFTELDPENENAAVAQEILKTLN